MDRNHVYNGIKAIKKRRQAKQVASDDVPASRVLQFSNSETSQAVQKDLQLLLD